MDQAAVKVGTDMRFHAKVPLVSLLALMHLRIVSLIPVLGRGRCRDQGRIDDGALFEHQPLFGQIGVDRLEDDLGQTGLFQQAAKLEQGRGIGCDSWLRSMPTKQRTETLS